MRIVIYSTSIDKAKDIMLRLEEEYLNLGYKITQKRISNKEINFNYICFDDKIFIRCHRPNASARGIKWNVCYIDHTIEKEYIEIIKHTGLPGEQSIFYF